ncbi:hypothetical protein AWH48_00660 [Domibacillus aminovorans]|uniref:Uncharacterized protein n=1 Tax=Domibacillus aminovorans TaxID=29332 RepID=A0A177L1W3_9BACI|nr:hypothetical protein AWH48_00660 [Domibacillus aminovorans]
MGGDLGEIDAFTVATEDKAVLVSRRAIRSLSQFRAEALADLRKKMSHCQKGSNQWKKYRQARILIRSPIRLE